ncbi:DNA methyltransferase [Thermoproteota archaeon]
MKRVNLNKLIGVESSKEIEKKRMPYLFLLSCENIDLAKEEVLAISTEPEYKVDGNVIVAETALNFKRLALTRGVYRFLFSCPRDALEEEMKKFNWKSIYKESFSLRIHRAHKNVKRHEKTAEELANHVWDAVYKPKVELDYPMTRIEIIITDKNAYCGQYFWEVNGDFAKRKSHLRPHNQPTSLNPKIARACVNVSGIKTGEVLMDPFCGAGGIMLEAGLMRFKTIGYDIDEAVLRKCMTNLDYYKVKRFKLHHMDAVKISERADFIVTDLPYGQGSHLSGDRDELYLNFLKNLKSIVKNKAVVIFPDKVDHKKLIASSDFKIEKEFSVYVHSSLTRNIVLLGKD